MRRLLARLGVLVCVAWATATWAQGDPALARQRISIGTGGTGGVYYPLGVGMAELINRHIPGVTANAEVTGASIENSRRVGMGEMEFGIANADALYFAWAGQPPFERKFPLLAVASLYPSTMQIAVLRESGIRSIRDLAGKRVSVGPPGGATRVMAENILKEYGILGSVREVDLSFTESVDAMKDRTLDGAFVLAGVPAAALVELATTQNALFLPIDAPQIEALLKKYPYYSRQTIPARVYRGQDREVPSIGVENVLFARADLDPELVYRVTRVIFSNLDYLVSIHPIAAQISASRAVVVPIPLHPGAERYFREVGALSGSR